MATNRKLGKTTDIRLAMLKTQVTDLLLHGQIKTTAARALLYVRLLGLIQHIPFADQPSLDIPPML